MHEIFLYLVASLTLTYHLFDWLIVASPLFKGSYIAFSIFAIGVFVFFILG